MESQVYIKGATFWLPNTAYTTGQYVVPPDGFATGFYYICVGAGTSDAAQPGWTSVLSSTFQDGTVQWQCAAWTPFICLKDLEDHLSRTLVREGADDNSDGFADADTIARLCVNASSWVVSKLGGEYSFPIGSPYPNELQRITLDVAHAFLAKRHPELFRLDWRAMLDECRKDVDEIRRGIATLDAPGVRPRAGGGASDANATPKAANVGGVFRDGAARLVTDDADGKSNGGDF